IDEWFAFSGNLLQNKARTFGSDGGYYEGVGYDNYALSEYLRYRLAWSRQFPERPLNPYSSLIEACEFFLQTFYPSSRRSVSVNFGDSALVQNLAPTIRLLNANGFGHPAASWLVSKLEPRSSPDAFEFLLPELPAVEEPRSPASKIYSDIGWSLLRTSWRDDATFLAVKSGFTWNHAHADSGSFVLFHGGVPLLIDSGSCGYGHPAYGNYYVQSRAHNVILAEGKGEPAEDHSRGSKFPGRLASMLDHMGLKYIYADATGPMSRYFVRNYRHWVWVDGLILIFDDIEAHEETRPDWLLHYAGSAEVSKDLIAIKNEGVSAEVRCFYPAISVQQEIGLADHRPEQTLPYYRLRAAEPGKVHKFITAIVPIIEAQPHPTAEMLTSGPLALGVRVITTETVSDIYLNLNADGRRMHLNSSNTIGGWDTDAYLFAWTRPVPAGDDPRMATRLFISCGSYLRNSGAVCLDSLSKVDAIWDPKKPRQGQVSGQPVRKVKLSGIA
ncbi:MAG: heparinase II/III-family protein, partial [Acidobacteriaceae bacterium]|nr:heparinase II/III-family protein [Acidobacteriaceae bacterium]